MENANTTLKTFTRNVKEFHNNLPDAVRDTVTVVFFAAAFVEMVAKLVG
jgi:hypothetical protein